MRSPLLLVALAAGAVGCGPGPDAVWLLILGEATAVDSEVTCTENFLEAECPVADEDPEPSPWTVTQTGDVSDQAVFALVTDAPGGQKLLVIGDEVYIGEKQSGSWRFTWSSFEESSEQIEHERGYTLSASERTTRDVVVLLDIGGGEGTGSVLVQSVSEGTVSESDGWLPEDTGFSRGQIADVAPITLDGNVENFNDLAECSGSVCEISVETVSTTELPFRAIRSGEGGDAFDALRDAGQDAGT
jgi:hypothetical protein